MTHLLLVTIYLAFVSLGLPDSLFGRHMAEHVFLARCIRRLGRTRLFDDHGLHRHLESCKRPSRAKIRHGRGHGGQRGYRRRRRCSASPLSHALLGAAAYGRSPTGWARAVWTHRSITIVALHYASKSHELAALLLGLGATLGPQIMAFCLVRNSWQGGYRTIATIQFTLTAILLLSLPLWKKKTASAAASSARSALCADAASPSRRACGALLVFLLLFP